jgi:hypothetical protein
MWFQIYTSDLHLASGSKARPHVALASERALNNGQTRDLRTLCVYAQQNKKLSRALIIQKSNNCLHVKEEDLVIATQRNQKYKRQFYEWKIPNFVNKIEAAKRPCCSSWRKSEPYFYTIMHLVSLTTRNVSKCRDFHPVFQPVAPDLVRVSNIDDPFRDCRLSTG